LWGGVSSTHRLQRVASAGGAAEKVPPPVDATSGFGGLRTWPITRHGSSTTRMTQIGNSAINFAVMHTAFSLHTVVTYGPDPRKGAHETARVHHDARRGCCVALAASAPHRLTRTRAVCARFARASRTPVMSRVRTWRSNTAGPKINSIDCQRTRSRSPRLIQRIAETGALNGLFWS
jgi:hypothetical protein